MLNCVPMVGVNVSVSVCVDEGDAVKVSVGERVGAGVTVSVGEGSGRNVQLGSGVGVGEGPETGMSPTHPIKKKMMRPMIATDFFKGLQRVI